MTGVWGLSWQDGLPWCAMGRSGRRRQGIRASVILMVPVRHAVVHRRMAGPGVESRLCSLDNKLGSHQHKPI
jgi:hypothetical protein